MKKYFLPILSVSWGVLFIVHPLAAQSPRLDTLSGKVISASGEPVAGASIRLLKNGDGAVSREDGSFEITLSALPDTLVVSRLGYRTRRLSLEQLPPSLLVTMEATEQQLHELTVSTGYQDIPKERATGSFEKISNDLLNRRSSTDILSRLEGVSSVLFDRSSSSSIRPPLTIRGVSTINGPKAPLVILNNFPYEGDINNINPNDVESVTIMKDAAAASIWGTRAGNGVIVITTKKGTFNQPFQLSLNTNVTVAQKPDLYYLQQMSTSDYIDVEKFLFSQGYYNTLENDARNRPPLSPVVETLIAARDGQISEQEADSRINALRSRDVRDDFERYLYQPAVRQQYALSMSGGSEQARYYLSGGYDRNTDELDAPYRRLNLRSENTFQPLSGLQIDVSLAYTQSDSYSGKPGYQSFSQLYPYAVLEDEKGNALPLPRYRQPYTDTAGAGHLLDWNYYPLEDYKHDKTHTVLQDFVAGLALDYRIIKGLDINLKYQYERQSVLTRHLYDPESFYSRDLINRFSQINWSTGDVKYIIPDGSILDRTNEWIDANNIRAQLNYDLDLNQSSLSMIAGMEIREVKNNSSSYRTYGYNDDFLTTSKVDYTMSYPDYISKSKKYVPYNQSEAENLNRFVSFYMNAAYTVKERYEFSLSGRRDASNLFGVNTNDKWQPLWSAGAAWNISNETFFQNSFLDYLRIRATYGYSGNVDQKKSAVTTLRYIGTDQYTNLPYNIVSQFENPDLRWEKVKMINVGIDFKMKDNIINGSLEYYRKRGVDLFGDAPVDYTSGVGMPSLMKNVASMKGQGVDLNTNFDILRKKVFWTFSLSLNYNISEVSKYYLSSTNGSTYISNGSIITPIEGKPVFSVLSYRWAGLDDKGNPQGIVDGKPSTDYTTITGAGTQVDDLKYNGPAMPPVYGSLTNTFKWKEFSVIVAVDYKLGHYFRRKSINYGQLFLGNLGQADYAQRWKQPGDERRTNVPSMIYPNINERDVFYNASEILVEKADNIRLQYIDLSYTLPNRVRKQFHFQNAAFYVSLANIGIIWKADKHGIDPDYAGALFPPSKSISVGFKTNF